MSKIVYRDLTVTRTELYKLVWDEPMTKVAARFGHSDTAIAGACRRHNIPRPSRGYWAKKRAGKPIRKPRLPRGEDVTLTYRVFERDGQRVSHAEWMDEQRPRHIDWATLQAYEAERLKIEGWHNRLDGLVDDWHRANRIREFIHACRGAAETRRAEYAFVPEFSDWLAWASAHADKIDPMVSSLKLPGVQAIDSPQATGRRCRENR
ncbi:MAG: hypothetical protein JWP89_2701 [Schlesneria sp.]|nr:hypothetical protein [Schlesneria sp.]